jgi:pyruvate dehydrogenase (quinone)
MLRSHPRRGPAAPSRHRFPYDSFLPQAHTVQIDRDPSHLGRRSILDLGIAGDVGQTLRAVLPLLRRKTQRTFLDRMLKQHAEALERVVATYTRNIEHLRPIHREYVAAQLDSLAAEDAIFTVDTGMCNVWAARYLTPNGRRRVLGSFRHGSMANALPHAVGAQLAAPNRQVVSISGDGGLSMLMGELITAHTHQLPLTVVVFNNSSLGMIRLEMMVAGYPYYQTDHGLVDYAAIAAACGCRPAPWTIRPRFAALSRRRWRTTDHRCRRAHRPERALTAAHITGQQVKGFALASTKTVLDGGVGGCSSSHTATCETSPGPDTPRPRRRSRAPAAAPTRSRSAPCGSHGSSLGCRRGRDTQSPRRR